MAEHLYTIAINEHFGKKFGCPLCSLRDMIEKNEAETITGAAMMEPAVRIETNRHGFCFSHFSMILQNGKRLPVALILQSHLEEIERSLDYTRPERAEKYLNTLNKDCYLCARTEEKMAQIRSNIIYLWHSQEAFRALFARQPQFCLPHCAELLSASGELSKKERSAFCNDLATIQKNALKELSGDVDWFCRKFDYRFAKEDWKNSKDAIERTVQLLTSHDPRENKADPR